MTRLEMLGRLDSEAVQSCQKCGLCNSRKKTVFGEGDSHARVMFVGEAPGQQEDEQGRPFVGSAGNLLDGMIQACGWKREDVYITNPVKCRPPGNRTPKPEELAACRDYLALQIRVIDPEYIVCLGRVAAQWFFPEDGRGVTAMRGQIRTWQGRKVVVTYHPSFILHSDTDEDGDRKKRLVWEDLQGLLKEIETDRANSPTEETR